MTFWQWMHQPATLLDVIILIVVYDLITRALKGKKLS